MFVIPIVSQVSQQRTQLDDLAVVIANDVEGTIEKGLDEGSHYVPPLHTRWTREFADDDPEFLAMVEKAFMDEAKAVARRFAGTTELR